jgi:hypothetical protein
MIAVPGIGQIDGEVGAQSRRPVAEDDQPVRQQQGLLDVVGHHQHGEAAPLAFAASAELPERPSS